MVTLTRKAKLIIQGSTSAIILVSITLVAVLAYTGAYSNYDPKYSSPDPKASIHIATDGSVTAPSTYNETVPIQRNGDRYILTGDISLTVIVDRSNIVVDGSGFSVATKFQPGQGSPGYGLKVLGASNVTVENVNSPIDLTFEQTSNSILKNSKGVELFLNHSHDNVISNCTGSLQLRYASNNRIQNCTSDQYDIENSDSNSILYCTCGWNGRAILIWDAKSNILFGNVFPSTYWWITLGGSSSKNYFVANNITITQHYGADKFMGGTNYIYHNNFLQWSWNQTATDNSQNVWSQNGRGNYYGGYGGADGNHDGVVDTPFTIDVHNVDSYPLMMPVNTANEPIPTPPQ